MFKKDSVFGTIVVVVLLSLVCSVIVSGAAVFLKPTQQEQKLLDKQRNILSVAGLLQPNTDIKKAFAENIEPRLVDLNTGDFVASKENFDSIKEAKDPATSIALDASEDIAKIRRRANIVEVYLVKGSDGVVKQVVLPIYGTGLWSVMYGFISVQPDGNTVDGLTYYQQGETAGLGGEIANPAWQKLFVGKKLYNSNGEVALHVSKGGSADQEYGVDALSGATLTSNGVDNTFKFWFGPKGLGPFLEKVRMGALNNG
ncbi:Na(+)-translocating NADH-quinone reductase subunit C [Gallibacterium genomosp. 3]|uniref:Na(+)-translocating NADH-quinone reductase subunit C n=1 Tax=Gallibacterium genomosp. 3 TaxID=505345 RepID=A0A1A7PQT2_9PAST|nr:Na(+)-translocating NADH-quinone reductase subunit C [Gallibacterium genomosp. 3]OBX04111.1 Na(+)-translocating NADH-quinone reductase subunit C [Gallibacterium genomosp. 3]